MVQLSTRVSASESELVSSLQAQTATLKDLERARKQLAQLSGLCRTQQEELKALRQAGAASEGGKEKV